MGIVVVPAFGADPVSVTGPTLDAKVDGLATEFNGSIDNDNIKAAASIAYSKLNLTGLIVNADIGAAAAIAGSKLNLASGVTVIATTAVALSDGATPALNAALGNYFTLAAAGNRTIGIPTNATNGQKIIIRHLASGGARTLALNTGAGGFRYGTDITALTETASGKTDYIGAIYSSIDSFWDVVAVSKGY